MRPVLFIFSLQLFFMIIKAVDIYTNDCGNLDGWFGTGIVHGIFTGGFFCPGSDIFCWRVSGSCCSGSTVYPINPISTSGHNNIFVEFYVYFDLTPARLEGCYVDISYNNGSSWNDVFYTITPNIKYQATVDLPSNADNNPNLKIRFRVDSVVDEEENCHINDLRIYSNPATPPPTSQPTTNIPTTSAPTTSNPTNVPTSVPTYVPTTNQPTQFPTNYPSSDPTVDPTSYPNTDPTSNPGLNSTQEIEGEIQDGFDDKDYVITTTTNYNYRDYTRYRVIVIIVFIFIFAFCLISCCLAIILYLRKKRITLNEQIKLTHTVSYDGAEDEIVLSNENDLINIVDAEKHDMEDMNATVDVNTFDGYATKTDKGKPVNVNELLSAVRIQSAQLLEIIANEEKEREERKEEEEQEEGVNFDDMFVEVDNEGAYEPDEFHIINRVKARTGGGSTTRGATVVTDDGNVNTY